MGLLDDAIREHLELKRRRGADPAEIARAEQEALGPVRRDREPAPSAPEEPLGDAASGGAGEDERGDRTQILFPDDRESAPVRSDEREDAPPLPPMPGSVPGTTSEHTRARDDASAEAPSAGDRLREHDLADPHADPPVRDDVAGGGNGDPAPPAPSRPSGDGDNDAPPASAAAAHPGAPAEPDEADRARDRDFLDQPTTEYTLEDLERDERRRGEPDDEDAEASSGDSDVLDETPDFLQETPEHDRLWFEQRPPRDFDFDD
jgi:hypothetical protein